MRQRDNKRNENRFLLIGFCVGVIVWIAAALLEAFGNKYDFDLSLFRKLHEGSLLFYVIDLIPFISAYCGFRIGQRFNQKDTTYNEFVEKEDSRNANLIEIVDQIKQGNFNVSNDDESSDKLIDSILALRDSLKASKDEEAQRKQEDEQRHWVAQGLAKFGEILRANNDDMAELSYNIISQLVKYTETNQGGIYLLSEEDSIDELDEQGNSKRSVVFEMKGCYAYERRKYVDKKIALGEGLVGSCAKEQKTVYLQHIPDTYLYITSGLGRANPKYLLLVPLIINEEVHGVLEIASFKPIEEYVIGFVEKVAESIASTVSNVKINIRTSQLLEESREQAEMLSSQEEEMRQNMEELQATQEESVRQTDKLAGYVNALDNAMLRAEFDSFGNLMLANGAFVDALEAPIFDDINERPIMSFIHPDDQVIFRSNWAKVVAEKSTYQGNVKFITFTGKPMYLFVAITRIDDKDGELDRVMVLGTVITESKRVEFENDALLKVFNNSLLTAELTTTGDFISFNEISKKCLGINAKQNSNINDFINDIERPNFDKAWKRLINNGSFSGVINLNLDDNRSVSLDVKMVTISNFGTDIVKIVMIAKDKSEIKIVEDKYNELKETTNNLEEQLKKTDEEINRRVRDVREELALQYKEADRIRKRNDKAVDNAPFPIIGFDSEGKIELFNKKATELWGYAVAEIMDQPVSKLFPAELIQGEGYVSSICDVDKIKPLNQKDKATIAKKDASNESVFITLSDARVTKDHNYIAYIEEFENN